MRLKDDFLEIDKTIYKFSFIVPSCKEEGASLRNIPHTVLYCCKLIKTMLITLSVYFIHFIGCNKKVCFLDDHVIFIMFLSLKRRRDQNSKTRQG